MDNDDFSDDTSTGANTSHRTNVMFVQQENAINLPPRSESALQIPRSLEVAWINTLFSLTSRYQEVNQLNWTTTTRPYTRKHYQKGLIHSLVRLDENYSWQVTWVSALVGSFAGFHTTVQPAVAKSKSYYFLTFSSPPSKAAVYEVMCRVAEAAKAKNMPFILLVLLPTCVCSHCAYQVWTPWWLCSHMPLHFVLSCALRVQVSCVQEVSLIRPVRSAGSSRNCSEGSVGQALRGK